MGDRASEPMPAPQTGTAKGISHATDPLGGQDATPLHQLQARPFQLDHFASVGFTPAHAGQGPSYSASALDSVHPREYGARTKQLSLSVDPAHPRKRGAGTAEPHLLPHYDGPQAGAATLRNGSRLAIRYQCIPGHSWEAVRSLNGTEDRYRVSFGLPPESGRALATSDTRIALALPHTHMTGSPFECPRESGQPRSPLSPHSSSSPSSKSGAVASRQGACYGLHARLSPVRLSATAAAGQWNGMAGVGRAAQATDPRAAPDTAGGSCDRSRKSRGRWCESPESCGATGTSATRGLQVRCNRLTGLTTAI